MDVVSAVRRLTRRARSDRGFTLVELMVSSSLLAVVITPALMFLTSTQRHEIAVSEMTQQMQANRLAIERMTRTLREGGFADGLSYQDSAIFVAADTTDTTLYSDLNNDGVTEKVRYYLSGTNLMRSVVSPDCSVSPCTYTATPVVTTLLTHVRNATPATCGMPATPVPLFTFSRLDRGTGALFAVPTPTTSISDLVDISYMTVNALVDITPDKAPTCSDLSTSVSMRNWRG